MLSYIGLGSNIGDGRAHCCEAIRAITADHRNRLLACSPFYRTEPVGKKDQDWFINAVIALETSLAPRPLLDLLLTVEESMGRERKERWGPRVIDLDLLFYGNEVLEETGLQIPHPRLQERRFVLIPLKDIAPGFKHPVLGKTITEILSEAGEGEEVFPASGPWTPGEGRTGSCCA